MSLLDVLYARTKTAAPLAAFRTLGRSLTQSPVRGALFGAGAGTVHSIAHKPEQESTLSAGLRGAAGGALLGGAAAGLGRAYRDTRLLNPGLGSGKAVAETGRRALGGLKEIGRRQLHGLTGIGTSGRTSVDVVDKIDLLRHRMQDMAQAGELSAAEVKRYRNKIKDLRELGRRGDLAQKAGVTSIPGVVKGIATKPVETAKALGREFAGGSRFGAAAGVGVPVAISAPELARGDESSVGGRTVGQKLTRLGANVTGGALTAGLPVIPQVVAGSALDTAGEALAQGRRGARKAAR